MSADIGNGLPSGSPNGISTVRAGMLFEYGSLNGGEFSLLAVLNSLNAEQVRPIALCPAHSPLAEQLDRCQILREPSPDWRMPAAELAEFLQQFIVRNRLHLLHANSLMMGRRLGRVSNLLTVPTTSHIRDLMKLSPSAVAELQAHCCLIAVSEATRQYHIRQGVEATRITTIHNGIDLDTWRPQLRNGWLRQELELKEDVLLAATIGQICLRKGQADAIAAFVQVAEKIPQLHFLLVGVRHSSKQESVEYDEQLDAVIEAAGLTSRFHRLGFRSDVVEILPELDLLVHPARQEPFGRVLLEAAARGMPIVATDVGGTSEMLQHGESAWLVPPGHPEQLANGIEQLLTDRRQAEMMGRRARRRIEQNFPISSAAEKLLAVWRSASSSGAASPRASGVPDS